MNSVRSIRPSSWSARSSWFWSAVGREFSQHDGRRHDAGLQRRAPYRCGRCGCCGSAGTAALARRRRGQPPRGSRGCAPYPSHGAFCRSRALDREHQAVSALAQAPVVMLVTISWRLWAARRSPAFRSAEHGVLKQHHEEPEREASRCLVRAAVLVCVRDDLMPDRLLPGPQVPVIFRIARDCEADHTRLHAKETTSMTINVATGISRILKQEGVGWVSTFPVCRVNNALGREGGPMLMMRDDRYAVAVAAAFSRITAGSQGGSRIGVCSFQGGVNAAGMQYAYAGMAQAYEDGSPVLCITDGVPAGSSGNSQYDVASAM